MARPKNKAELISLSNENYEKLLSFINILGEETRNGEFPKGTMNRNIRDVLTHLHEWHLMVLKWYEVGMTGEKPDMPAKGYTWKTTPELNRFIWEKYQKTSLKDARKDLNKSFKKIQELIHKHSNEELFEKKRYKWTGSTSMGSYLVSCTSSHYDWAFKLIKKAVK
ncbi:MAG: ClbS/DfsB family four-helix bundle protein [Bacteroidia bacterium]|nr:ClbS/DfsB family four-helix bundle protein [Bacteroidia bacterium]